jgi:hypothetical protein
MEEWSTTRGRHFPTGPSGTTGSLSPSKQVSKYVKNLPNKIQKILGDSCERKKTPNVVRWSCLNTALMIPDVRPHPNKLSSSILWIRNYS